VGLGIDQLYRTFSRWCRYIHEEFVRFHEYSLRRRMNNKSLLLLWNIMNQETIVGVSKVCLVPEGILDAKRSATECGL